MKKILLYLCCICASVSVMGAGKNFSLYALQCEQGENPLGIEDRQPHFSWKIHALQRGFTQSAYQLLVSESQEKLLEGKETVWNSGKIKSNHSVLVPYEGDSLKAATKYYWKVRVWDQSGKVSEWSRPHYFVTGLLSKEDWGQARWIALEEDRKEWYTVPGIHEPDVPGLLGSKKIGMYKLPQFRKEFVTSNPVTRAFVFVSGLGHFDLFLNNKKVGDHFLDPGWTRYDKSALYVTFDVTDCILSGKNVLGVMLGNGFYNIPRERFYKQLVSYGAPKMKLMLRLEYSDGTSQEVVSDASWRATESPITFSSIYGGEDYDATKMQTRWKEAGFDDALWQTAKCVDYPYPVYSQQITPLKEYAELSPVKIYKNSKGHWIYDLGQNFAGVIRVRMQGEEGQKIVFRPGELLNPDSTVNQSASGAPYYFAYTLRGDEDGESWQPQFSYYGFRYVQVEGAAPKGKEVYDPEIIQLKGIHTCNSAPESGTFVCSKPMFNRIYELIDWAMRSNMASVLTDCPHREKLGWLEEAHLMQYSLQYRYNLSRLYNKIMADMRQSQNEKGVIATIAPEYVHFAGGFEDTPEWGSAFIISPWYIYKWYGDERLLSEYYPDMQRYLDYLGTRAENHIIAYGLGDWYDLGPKAPGYAQLTSNGVTATAIYYYDTIIMEQIASLLGKKEDAKSYHGLSLQIKKAFNEKYFQDGKYDLNSQTANAIALYTGLADGERGEAALENLIRDIEGRDNALTAGDVGYRYVLRTLEANNASELIYAMNSKYDVPGYGWQLAHGATALTESWQAYGFVSNNHFMLGHLMEWFFSGLGGIRQSQDSKAFQCLLIDPQPVGDVHSARTTYESPYGTVLCEWKKEVGTFSLKVNVPANSEAIICLPAEDLSRVTEYGRPVIGSKEFNFLQKKNEKILLKVASGEYFFEVK